MPITLNLEPDELVVGSSGLILVSDEGTTLPTDIDTVIPDWDAGTAGLATGWGDLGYTTEEGPRLAFGRDITDIGAWQSFNPLRSIVTGKPSQVEFDLRQWNSDTFGVAMGGVVVSTAGGGVMVEPEDDGFLDVRQLIVYAEDGDKHYAWVFRRVQNTKELGFPFARTDESALPIGMKVLGAGSDKAWYMLTDDPAFTVGS